MERLGDDARRLLTASGLPDLGSLGVIADAWPAAVGDAIARAAWPSRVARDGTLHVATTSSAWAFELARLAPEIHARLRAALGDVAPAALRFAPGPVPEPPPEAAGAATQPPEIYSEDRAQAVGLASAIDDPALRELVARAASASLARARADRAFC